jgi:ribosomal protein S18 acetylase RimI-like enzyme
MNTYDSFAVTICNASIIMIFTVSGKQNLIQLREFNINAQTPSEFVEYYIQQFKEFAKQNYPTIPTAWSHEDIEFTVLIESGSWRIIGLMVAVPYDGDKMHIRFIAVAEDYRYKGLGTRLLTHIAAKYPKDEITLNITMDRLYLLDFYCKKGYAVQKEMIKEQQIIVLSLNNINLLSKLSL